ncbi:WD40 repeat-like protein [Lojkania enalia]|uniref:WD40 repeat-like protein n=1 Tax=Lojkania enalia TaxID=147567 RepID=A0A9P4K739_9PLEO|nr:WD40 repeat-like protein [Didymosphaeria enalia]
MPSISREDFLDAYDLPLEPVHDFQLDSKSAEWAPENPKEWGKESDSFPLPDYPPDNRGRAYSSIRSAVSGDAKLLAIGFKDKIWIYDIQSQELRQELDGAGQPYFSPIIRCSDEEGAGDSYGRPAYTLLTAVPTIRERGALCTEKLILWDLDKNGRLLDQEEPIDTSKFARKAVESIAPELEEKHEWSKDFIDASELLAKFERALREVAADHRRRSNAIFDNACAGSFGSSPFSSDGKKLMFRTNEISDKPGKPSSDQCHQVVVLDIESGEEQFRMRGHTDNIMWFSFSPDDQHIATVAWDGTMRMYNGADGSLQWVENHGGQCWSAAFSPDSEYIVWSCENGRKVKLHSVADGQLISELPHRPSDWCRNFTWNYDGKQIALCEGRKAIVWKVLDGPENGEIVQLYEFAPDPTREFFSFAQISSVQWFDNGKKLGLTISDGSYLVWDSQMNTKELFKRPNGLQVAWTNDGLHYIPAEEGGSYITVDGDCKVRYWRTSSWKPSGLGPRSWWEKKKASKEYPETGKYVNITMHAKPKEGEGSAARKAWAEKGAELLTAQ